ncbi:hypothetical protein CATMIT_01809, partial [Catenibacterium mitsuokai DSM 15897]
ADAALAFALQRAPRQPRLVFLQRDDVVVVGLHPRLPVIEVHAGADHEALGFVVVGGELALAVADLAALAFDLGELAVALDQLLEHAHRFVVLGVVGQDHALAQAALLGDQIGVELRVERAHRPGQAFAFRAGAEVFHAVGGVAFGEVVAHVGLRQLQLLDPDQLLLVVVVLLRPARGFLAVDGGFFDEILDG